MQKNPNGQNAHEGERVNKQVHSPSLQPVAIVSCPFIPEDSVRERRTFSFAKGHAVSESNSSS